jgi:hypothetical protein
MNNRRFMVNSGWLDEYRGRHARRLATLPCLFGCAAHAATRGAACTYRTAARATCCTPLAHGALRVPFGNAFCACRLSAHSSALAPCFAVLCGTRICTAYRHPYINAR